MATDLSVGLHNLNAREMAEAVTARQVTPSDLVEASLARIAAVDGRVKAWSYLDAEGARKTAARLTAEAAAGKLRGPLHGVPIGVKDEFHVAGMPTGMEGPGAKPRPEDATSVAKLRQAGAIIMGKLHMPLDGVTPPTRNPWNLEHTPGGTSSGSGAAVSARMVPLTLAEQTAGSGIRPAAYTGVEAIKPTFGRIGRFGCFQFSWSFDHVCIHAQDLYDVALALSLMEGPDPRDPYSLPELPGPHQLPAPTDLRPPRLALVRNFFTDEAEPVMQKAVEQAADRFKGAGAQVVEKRLPEEFGLVSHLHRIIMGTEMLTFNERRRIGDPAYELSYDRLGINGLVPTTYYLQAQRIRAWVLQKVMPLFSDVDALLIPATPAAAPKGMATGNASFLVPWSCLGNPTITINGGLSPEGLPLGLQFVGPHRKDFELMAAGAWCSQVLGRLPAPPL